MAAVPGSGASTEDLIGELDVYLSAYGPDFSPASNNSIVSSSSVTGATNTQTRQSSSNMNHSTPGQDLFDSGGSGPKRKMDGDLGDIGFLGNPSKVPKIEPKTPGSPQLLSASSPRVMSGDNMSSGIKTEIKSELESDNIGAGRLMTPGTGAVAGNFSNSDETFLFDGGSSGTGNTGNISTEQPVDRLLLSKTAGHSSQGNSSAAAKIKNALEASGLSGNLTAEDLQTLKKLNEIAKSQELTQEQKSSEASQLLKNNPNVSRLLLKLRTEKNISRGGPEPGPGMSGQYHGQFPQHIGDRDGSPSVNSVLPPSYNSNYPGGHQQQQQSGGANNNNYQSPMGVGPGQWTGSQDYYGHNPGHMPAGHNMPGQYPGYMGPMRGPNHQMFGGPPMSSMMDNRMHPGMNMGPGAPRTMYIRDRQTGMLIQDYPGHMMRPGPGHGAGYGGPPPYMGPNTGYHHGQMMPRARMMSPMISPGPGSPYNPRHAGPAPMYPDYDNNFAGTPPAGAAVNFQRGDFRDQQPAGMMANNKFPGNDFPGSGNRGPPHSGVSQLRERLSRPGPGINNSSSSGNMTGGSELANRLLHGKPQHEPPRYMEHNNANFNNGNNIKSESDSLFDEIDYFNSADNNTDQNQSSLGNYNYDNSSEPSNGFNEQVGDAWKNSSGTKDVRQTMLRKLSTAIESNKMSVAEAFKLATEIEKQAFAVANSEADYTSKIALQLAQIFSQSKSAAAPTETGDTCPDSTSTWQDQTSGQPSNSSPDSSQSFKPESSSHFQSDTTLNCFQDTNDIGDMNCSGSSPGVVVSSESSFPTPQGTNVIQRGARRLSGKTSSSLQPHSVDSGIGSPRSNSLYSPTTPITPKTSSSPSVSLSENSPEK